MIKWLRLVILILCLNLQSQAQFTTVNYSIQAHQDDWQLFWSSRIIADMSIANSKMVFITITAGDASSGDAAYGGGGIPIYLSREIGSMYASKFAADLTTGTAPLDPPGAQTVTINGNTVTKYVYKNTVNYFLRLPDGNLDGLGFNNNNMQSLYKLRNSSIPQNPQISSMNVIGNTAGGAPANLTYSWSELVATVRQIINDERIPGTQSWIHTPHHLASYNVNDHSDHIHSGLLAQASVASGMSWVGYTGFMDYRSSSEVPNLSKTEHANAAILFGLETWGMTEYQYQNDFYPDAGHLAWLPMDYFVVLRTPSGTAPSGPVVNPGGNVNPGGQLQRIPMIITHTSPVYIDKEIKVMVSPYETGQLTTTIYDISGSKVSSLNTPVMNTDPLLVTMPQSIKAKGIYLIETILNGKYTETRKIEVE